MRRINDLDEPLLPFEKDEPEIRETPGSNMIYEAKLPLVEDPDSPEDKEAIYKHTFDVQQKINFRYKVKLLRGIKVIMQEILVFMLLYTALYKNSILSLIYFYLAVQLVTSDTHAIFKVRVVLGVSLCLIFQYLLCLPNWNQYNSPDPLPVPFNHLFQDHQLPPVPIPWAGYITLPADWMKYFLIDDTKRLLESLV